jgi:L-iditol 2-dehydrogenase
MKCAVLYNRSDIRIEEKPTPQPGAGELLVRTRACGICSGDVMGWYIERKAPLVLGHEPAGEIVEIGSSARAQDEEEREFAVGDRVFVHHHAPCLSCAACAGGDYVQCEQWRSTSLDPGGMTEYFRVPKENVCDTLLLPDSVSFVDASLVEPLACVVKSLRRGGVRSGDCVLVVGLGVMGQLHVLAARTLGAIVFGTDFIDERRSLAERNGASTVEPAEAHGVQADVVICGPGTARALGEALAAVRPGGTVVMFTPLDPKDALTLDADRFYFKDLRLVASYSCGPNDTREALGLIARGIVSAEKIGVVTFPLDRVAEAYAALAESRIVKPVVVFG